MEKQLLALIVQVTLALTNGTELRAYHSVVKGLLKSELYHNNLIPSSPHANKSLVGQEPLKMLVNLGFRSIDQINDKQTEFTVTVSFRLKWKDIRLRYEAGSQSGYVTIHDDFPYKPWVPDILVGMERTSVVHSVISRKNVFYRIFPDGTVLSSAHVTLTTSCGMQFLWFPFDEQTCVLRIGTWAYQVSSLDFFWDSCCSPVQNALEASKGLHKLFLNPCRVREVLQLHAGWKLFISLCGIGF